MLNCASFQVQMASIMEVLTKTAIAEITKIVYEGSAELRLEMFRSQRENETLKRKLLQMERELGAVRGYGEGALEVQFCDEFREAPRPKFAGKGIGTGPITNDRNVPVEKEIALLDALDIKYESVDREQDLPETMLPNENRLEEDPGRSQSQKEQKISGENMCGTLGAAAAGADGDAGPLCGEEELHMQPRPAGDPEKGLQAELKQMLKGQPLIPALPPLGCWDWGLELQCAWSARLDDDFSPQYYTASQRQRLEVDEGRTSHIKQEQNGAPLTEEHSHGPPDDISADISAEMPLPLGSPVEHGGSAPCEASLDTSTEAKSHQTIEGQEEFICTRTRSWGTFSDVLQLKTHEEQHGSGKRFSCSEGSKGFTSSSVLEKHQQIHSRKNTLACSRCDKSFSNRHALQKHKGIHTVLKPHVCTQCGKRFRDKCYLKTHERVHTGEKPFTCLQCGKCFKYLNVLKNHQTVHTGEKPYHCSICGKNFTQQCNLKSHQRVHTGEKPYHCTECGKNFAQCSNLKSHQRVHTREKPFSCTLCGCSFSLRHILEEHICAHSKGIIN